MIEPECCTDASPSVGDYATTAGLPTDNGDVPYQLMLRLSLRQNLWMNLRSSEQNLLYGISLLFDKPGLGHLKDYFEFAAGTRNAQSIKQAYSITFRV